VPIWGGCVVRYPVDPETVSAAERIGNYFKATAINVFTGMADPNIADAVRVLQVLRILRQGSIAVSTILFRHVGERYTVRFSYDPDLVELLKDSVPACARSWDLVNYTPDIWVPNVSMRACPMPPISRLGDQRSSAREEGPGGG
jgi:hypothetical protein